MPDQEHIEASPDEAVVHHVKVWRARDRAAIGNPCIQTKRAEYLARQRLREVADLLQKTSSE